MPKSAFLPPPEIIQRHHRPILVTGDVSKRSTPKPIKIERAHQDPPAPISGKDLDDIIRSLI